MFDNHVDAKDLLWLVMFGALAGIGQLLASSERLTRRLVLGRAVSSGVLAMGAGALLIWIPDVPEVALYGVTAATPRCPFHCLNIRLPTRRLAE